MNKLYISVPNISRTYCYDITRNEQPSRCSMCRFIDFDVSVACHLSYWCRHIIIIIIKITIIYVQNTRAFYSIRHTIRCTEIIVYKILLPRTLRRRQRKEKWMRHTSNRILLCSIAFSLHTIIYDL